MRACHAAGPCSIPGRDKFPERFFGGFFLTCKTNVMKLQAPKVPEYHLPIIIIHNHFIRAPMTLDVDAPLNQNIHIHPLQTTKTCNINLLDGIHCLKCFSHNVSGVESTPVLRRVFVVRTTVLFIFHFNSFAVTGIRTYEHFRSPVLWIICPEL